MWSVPTLTGRDLNANTTSGAVSAISSFRRNPAERPNRSQSAGNASIVGTPNACAASAPNRSAPRAAPCTTWSAPNFTNADSIRARSVQSREPQTSTFIRISSHQPPPAHVRMGVHQPCPHPVNTPTISVDATQRVKAAAFSSAVLEKVGDCLRPHRAESGARANNLPALTRCGVSAIGHSPADDACEEARAEDKPLAENENRLLARSACTSAMGSRDHGLTATGGVGAGPHGLAFDLRRGTRPSDTLIRRYSSPREHPPLAAPSRQPDTPTARPKPRPIPTQPEPLPHTVNGQVSPRTHSCNPLLT